ncbi:TonB-dependent siderophore receptor [Sphingomonas sp. BK580]|uniref:TonB-dependent siderophore receptor n=1 Tax=Sphingomonas sp. BK580 TaxID=2586972 RepID=UPI001618B092|nr:TonB-dependent siderophore receptor [Sphingomonas sp. BK580]MBB3691715.1 iron complex outermembrane receptor protein [Sphingomonas sp. BK580]
MNNKRAIRLLASTVAGGVALAAAPAAARPFADLAAAESPAPAEAPAPADDSSDRDDILVTGERERRDGRSGAKTDTPLIALPQTVTVIDEDELTRRNALSINQALGYVAGVAPNQRGNVATRYDQLFLRGFTPGVFMDGMRQQGGVYSSPQTDFHLVESVDVIKGPASVLYGSGTPGGLINLTSKLPYAEAGGRLELAGGNFDLLRSAIDLNQPLDRDGRWQFRVIAGGERSDGFLRHTRNRRNYARPMLTFAPDDRTSVTLILSYQRDPKASSYSGVPAYGSALPNPFGTLPVDLNVSEPGYEAFDRKQKSATLLFRHRLSDALTWTTNARYYDVDLHYRQIYLSAFRTAGSGAARATDFSTIVRGGGGSDERFRTITLDNRLAAEFATGPVRHVLLAGLDYAHNEGRNDQGFLTGETSDPTTSISDFDLFAPRYGGTLPSFALTQTRNFRRIDQTGAYVQDQMSLGGLNLIASGRWDWYDQLTRNRTSGAVTRSSQTAFTARLGALYETTWGVAPFASYAESFEPQTGATFEGTAFVPVTGRQYEAGLKFQPRGTEALFTLSAFDLRRQNVPVADPSRPNFQIQVGEVKVRGIELDGRGEVAPGVTVVVAGSYTDSLVTSGTVAVGSGGQLAGVTGTRPLGVPRWSASSFLSWDLGDSVAGALGGVSVGGGVRYVGESDGTASYVRNNATIVERFDSPGYVLADALLGYDLGALDRRWDGLSLSVNASNLFDTRHIASCFFNNSCYYGASRTVVGTLRYAW